MRYMLAVVAIVAISTVGIMLGNADSGVDHKVTATHVFDGDTFRTSDSVVVRLAGIDAPERGEAGYAQATAALGEFIGGRLLTLGETDTDRYGRTLACVYRGGRSVDNYMIEAGFARPWKGVRC